MACNKSLENSNRFLRSTKVPDDADVCQRDELSHGLNHVNVTIRQAASSSSRGIRQKKVTVLPRGDGNFQLTNAHHRIHYHHQLNDREDDQEKKKTTFCQAWCDMWFLLARTRMSCIALTAFLFASGILLIFLTAFGGLAHCPHLTGAAVFCILMAILSISLGFLCCCYHWVKDDDDLPFAIFCTAYCLLLLFQFVTVAGTVVVFTHIHPIGPNQPPPYESTMTSMISDCGMTELPLSILIISYILAISFVVMSYLACILALGASSDVDYD